jgi:predicted transposase/invertase (TIGR01784 family)
MPFRMADYYLRIYRRFPSKHILQVVIYLKFSQSSDVYQNVFELPRMRHEFDIVRLWEEPASNFLTSPGLLPFAALAQTNDRVETLQQVAIQVEQLSNRSTQSNIAASAAVLAGLLLDKSLVQAILRKEVMQESVIYQEIKAEGRQEGRQEGIEVGERSLVLRLLSLKLGKLPESVALEVTQLSKAHLPALEEALLSFETLGDLTSWLQVHR